MGNTDGQWIQDTPSTDQEIFVGASEFKDISANSTNGSAGPGLFSMNIAAGKACTFFADITALLKRTGMYASAARDQQQFGTAASQPGPSTVSGTSGPEGISGYPPMLAAQMPTISGSLTAGGASTIQIGPVKKGAYPTSVDLIYSVAGGALSVATVGLTDTVFANNVAPAVTNRIALGANGMPTANQANPYTFNVPTLLSSQNFATTSKTQTILNVNLTTGAGTAVFYGAVLHCTFNYN
jgi:hypothetical protein